MPPYGFSSLEIHSFFVISWASNFYYGTYSSSLSDNYFLFRVDKSSNRLICVINFKPTLLSHRVRRSTPDMVWLNPKSRFKLIPELIASRAPARI
jgi:hypothetical protein